VNAEVALKKTDEGRLKPVVQAISGAVEPHSIEAEQALLGAIMLDNNLLDEVDAILRPHQFYVPFHEQIFETIQHLVGKGWEASPLTLRDSLRKRETFDSDGELIDHLTKLAENASLSRDISALAEIIQNHHQQRHLLGVARQLGAEAAKQLTPEDTEELIAETEAALFEVGESGGRRDEVNWDAGLEETILDIFDGHDGDRKLLGSTSGIEQLDNVTGGFRRSDLIVLAGRPSMGKTALVMNWAFSAAQAMRNGEEGGAGVGIFSLEMSREQLMLRFVAGASELDGDRMSRGQLNDAELAKLEAKTRQLKGLNIVIDDTPALHINTLRSRARRMVRKHNIGVIVVDYIQLMQGTRRNGDSNRVQEISEISRGLKSIARELDVPVIALSQLSRAVESRDNKRPQLSDLREGGSIEQDADVVMFIYREEYYKEKQFGPRNQWTEEQKALMRKIQGQAELSISKNRKGATANVALRFYPGATRFTGVEVH